MIASAKIINRNIRMFLGKIRSKKRRYVLVRIQSFYKMRIQVRKFIEARENNEMYKRKKRMEIARKKIMDEKKQKAAVLRIEVLRYRILHLRELKLLRHYLGKLPYECRGVYFKFMDVKRSSNELLNSYMNFIGHN